MLVDQNLEALRSTLSGGHPIVVGILMYPSIKSIEVECTGFIPLPTISEMWDRPIGVFAIILVGYDDVSSRFIFRNSWGVVLGAVWIWIHSLLLYY